MPWSFDITSVRPEALGNCSHMPAEHEAHPAVRLLCDLSKPHIVSRGRHMRLHAAMTKLNVVKTGLVSIAMSAQGRLWAYSCR